MALSVAERKRQLLDVGYNGPTDDASVMAAFARTATPQDLAAANDQPAQQSQPSAPDNSAAIRAQTDAINRQTAAAQAAAQRADQQAARATQAAAAANAQDFAQQQLEFNQNHALALQEFGLKQEAQAFEERIRQAGLDLTAATLTGTYQGQPTLAAQKQQAELSGMFNGQPTESAREFNIGEAEKQRQFNVGTEQQLADLASKLTGPADYFNFLNATNAGRSIIGSLQTGQARPQFGQIAGNPQPQTLETIFGRLGIGGQGASAFGTQAGGQASGIPAAGTQNTQGMIALPNNMGYIPQPHMINPAVWDSWGKAGQEFIKGAAASAGLDPTWYESTVNSTRPGGATFSPSSQSAFSSGGESAF